ncbi:MAG TPA: mechanosensitive ion channel [Desulfobulbus sp.]|nr:mechanosensitive ion channel [Desulfobulbus sp.]
MSKLYIRCPKWLDNNAAAIHDLRLLSRYSMMGKRAFIICGMLLLSLATVFTVPSRATDTTAKLPTISQEQISTLKESIRSEKTKLEKLKQDITTQKKDRDRQLAGLQNKTVNETTLEQARLAMESAKVNVQSAALDLANQKKQLQALQAGLVDLQHQIDQVKSKQNSQDQLTTLQQQLAMADITLALEQQYAELLTKHLEQLQQKKNLAASWWQSVQAVFQKQNQIRHQESLEDMKHRLQEQENKVQRESLRLQKKLSAIQANDTEAVNHREYLKIKLNALQESLNILRTKIKVQAMKSTHDAMGLSRISGIQAETLLTDTKTLRQIEGELRSLISLTSDRLTVYQQKWTLLQKQYALKDISPDYFTKEKRLLTDLIDQFSSLLTMMQSFSAQVQQNIDSVAKAYSTSIQQSLTARQPLPHDLLSWKNLFFELTSLPKQLQQLLYRTVNETKSGWEQSSPMHRLLFLGSGLILSLFVFLLGRCCSVKETVPEGDLTFSLKTKLVSLSLLRSSRPSLFVAGLVLLFGKIFTLESDIFLVLLLFVSVWFGLQLIIKFSYWLFVSPLIAPSRHQPRLYHVIVWVAVLSALFALLVGLGKIGLFSAQLRNVIDRLFMLLLLPVVYFFLHLRAVLIAALNAHQKKQFVTHIMVPASFLVPLTVLTAALVGLVGYINLAWFVAGKLALFLAVVFGWGLARDLVKDFLNRWERRTKQKGGKNEIPESVFMAPLKRIVDLLLFLTALWCLARLYGWGMNTAIADFLSTWLNHPLFHLGNQEITLMSLLTSIFLLLLFFYLSLLARNLIYVWLYNNVKDRGLKNSLSIFTQYAVIVIGVLVALNVIGINLTSLTVFAGALGVGIGFGLQNIANNLISGLILLAERPVRVEDWVTVGDSQGIISRIGLRSLVLTTWDNQDIIIPNASLITNPVTNWTLSNNLIRTVFQVGVRYQDDPHRAREVILDAVSMVPEVSLEQKPRIYLTDFADSSVNFRVAFFSELKGQHSRLEAKSKVMFAIWDALKDADIGIPFPQQDIYIKEIPIGSDPESSAPGRENVADNTEGIPAGR